MRPTHRNRTTDHTEVEDTVVGQRPVRIVRSSRRRRTLQAVMRGDTVEVRVPRGLDPDAERTAVADLVAKLERRHISAGVDLTARAQNLARRFGLPEPSGIRWVSNQHHRWGSCTPATGQIRISDRLAAWPPWVLDYVIVHELAHLERLHHDEEFHRLVDRYPLAERARGFLMAMSLEG